MADDLSPIVSEFPTEAAAESYNRWVKAKVEKSITSAEPHIPHDQVMKDMRAIIRKNAPDLDI